jgi:hypothetical protein
MLGRCDIVFDKALVIWRERSFCSGTAGGQICIWNLNSCLCNTTITLRADSDQDLAELPRQRIDFHTLE